MNRTETVSRILQLERERDALVRANLKLRDFLLAQARECKSCEGTGCSTEVYTLHGQSAERVIDCPDCAPEREVLNGS
jgi:hypothetical protein